MKVLFTLPSNTIGGAELSALNLIRYLHGNGHKVFLSIPKNHKKFYQNKLIPYAHETIEIQYMSWHINLKFSKLDKIFNYLYRSLKSMWHFYPVYKLVCFIKKNNIDIVVTNTLAVIDGALASKVSRVPHIQYVRELTGFHQGSIMALPFQKHPRIFNILSKRLFGTVIYNSRYCMDFNNIYFKHNKHFVLHNSLCEDFFDNTIKFTKFNQNKTITIGTIANITPVKKLDLLIDIAAIFKDKSKYNYNFNIYGNASDIKYKEHLLNRIHDLNLCAEFNFKGVYINSKDIYKEIDFLIHPGDGESFGRIYIESMVMGIPILAADSGAANEIIDNNKTGFVIKNSDKVDYFNTIENLLIDNKKYNTIVNNGIKRASDFHISIIGKTFEEILLKTSKISI